MSGLFEGFAAQLSRGAFRRAERLGKIDEDSSFFRVAPNIWRFAHVGRCIHFYCEVSGGKVMIDLSPIGAWIDGKQLPFDHRLALEKPEELSEEMRQNIVRKIGRLPWVREVEVLQK